MFTSHNRSHSRALNLATQFRLDEFYLRRDIAFLNVCALWNRMKQVHKNPSATLCIYGIECKWSRSSILLRYYVRFLLLERPFSILSQCELLSIIMNLFISFVSFVIAIDHDPCSRKCLIAISITHLLLLSCFLKRSLLCVSRARLCVCVCVYCLTNDKGLRFLFISLF